MSWQAIIPETGFFCPFLFFCLSLCLEREREKSVGAISDIYSHRRQLGRASIARGGGGGDGGGGVSGEGVLFALIAFLEDTPVCPDAFGFAKRFSDVADMLPSDG